MQLPCCLKVSKKLEYRGYDSAGVCVQSDGQLRMVKKKGPIAVLEMALSQMASSRNDRYCSCKQCLEQAAQIEEIAKSFVHNRNFLYLGRGFNFPVALEGALKLKEISYIHAEGYPAAEMKHGPIALIDQDMPVFFVAAKSHIYDKILSNMQEVKARKGRIITIIDEPSKIVESLSDYTIIVPKTIDEIFPGHQ